MSGEAPSQDMVTDDLPAAPCRPVEFGDVGLVIERRVDGVLILSSRVPLAPFARNLLATFWQHGDYQAERTWIARRDASGEWKRLSYAEGRAHVSAVARWLRRLAVPAGRSIMVLSENSPAHAIMIFGAMAAGVPICSVSVNYSLLGTDHERLRHVVDLVRPAVVFAERGEAYARAIAAVMTDDTLVVCDTPETFGARGVGWDAILAEPDVEAVGDWVRKLDPTVPARYLLTSGSTDTPKAVIHTQAMMAVHAAASFQAMGAVFGWDRHVLDWLPWSHVAGSSVLTNISCFGGTMYIDDGRPTPELFGQTVQNLRELPLRFYATMPSGYAMLAEALEADAALRRTFFGDLRAMLFGGAGLPQPLHDRLQRLAVRTTGQRFAFVSGYGSTETCSGVCYTWWPTWRVGIGLPIPGTSLKLVPADGAYEVRVKGPSVTPGYVDDPVRTRSAFDDEGYVRMEDMADFHDPTRPEEGLFFAGRVAEQFKLSNGTFVAAGRLRDAVLRACPGLFTDVVICGEGRDGLGILAWPSAEGIARLVGKSDGSMFDGDRVRSHIAKELSRHNATHPGQSTRLTRLLLLTEPPSVEAREISDKGSINRVAVLRRRRSDVERLFASEPDPDIVLID